MASQLDDIERIFRDISNHSKVKSLEICTRMDTNHDLQLEKHKNHLATLKTMLLRLQGQSHFLENTCMGRENWSSADSMEMAEHEENAKKECKDDKKTIELLETDIDNLAETLCTKHAVLKKRLEVLEQRLRSTKDEKIKFETLKVELEQRANELEEETNSRSLDQLKSIPFETDLTIKHYNASISSLEHCRELLQVEDVRLEDDVNELIQDFMLQQQIKLNNQQREFSVRQWLADAVELHSTLGNVSVQSMQGDTVVLEIPSEEQAKDEPGPPLILTVKFRLEGGIQAVFAGAKINLDLLHIDDLVNEAIGTNNVVGFILEVKRRFRNQLSLITEVQELRANYAIDWEPSHSRIRVMLGRSGKVVCTLKVDPLTSTGRENVYLLGVEGSSNQTGIQQLQSDGANRTLKTWIKDLQELFSAEGAYQEEHKAKRLISSQERPI